MTVCYRDCLGCRDLYWPRSQPPPWVSCIQWLIDWFVYEKTPPSCLNIRQHWMTITSLELPEGQRKVLRLHCSLLSPSFQSCSPSFPSARQSLIGLLLVNLHLEQWLPGSSTCNILWVLMVLQHYRVFSLRQFWWDTEIRVHELISCETLSGSLSISKPHLDTEMALIIMNLIRKWR